MFQAMAVAAMVAAMVVEAMEADRIIPVQIGGLITKQISSIILSNTHRNVEQS